MHYISGNVYTGLWAADHFEGKGVIIYTHGPHTQYEGSWEAGKRSGHGKCCYRQGQGVTIEEIEGNWSKNHTKGKAQIKYTDGSVYGELLADHCFWLWVVGVDYAKFHIFILWNMTTVTVHSVALIMCHGVTVLAFSVLCRCVMCLVWQMAKQRTLRGMEKANTPAV